MTVETCCVGIGVKVGFIDMNVGGTLGKSEWIYVGPVGILEGTRVGDAEGIMVGAGDTEGALLILGSIDGCIDDEGASDGVSEGTLLGLGDTLGVAVGDSEGILEG